MKQNQEIEERSKEEILKSFPKTESGTFKYTLKEPIEYGQETKKELFLVKPKAKHLRNMPVGGKMKMGDFLDVMASIANEPASVIDELCADDMNEITEFISVFM